MDEAWLTQVIKDSMAEFSGGHPQAGHIVTAKWVARYILRRAREDGLELESAKEETEARD